MRFQFIFGLLLWACAASSSPPQAVIENHIPPTDHSLLIRNMAATVSVFYTCVEPGTREVVSIQGLGVVLDAHHVLTTSLEAGKYSDWFMNSWFGWRQAKIYRISILPSISDVAEGVYKGRISGLTALEVASSRDLTILETKEALSLPEVVLAVERPKAKERVYSIGYAHYGASVPNGRKHLIPQKNIVADPFFYYDREYGFAIEINDFLGGENGSQEQAKSGGIFNKYHEFAGFLIGVERKTIGDRKLSFGYLVVSNHSIQSLMNKVGINIKYGQLH